MRLLYLIILLASPIIAIALEPKPLTDEILTALSENGFGDIPQEKTEAFQKAILKAFLQGSDEIVGLEITPAKGSSEATSGDSSLLEQNTVALLSVNSFGGDFKACLEKLTSLQKENKPKVLLIDLRKSGGDDENSAKQLIDFCKSCKSPIGVLIDGGTHAVAESILPELKAAGATFFGTPTAGYPGPRKSVTLSNGSILHIPHKKSESVVPDVTLPDDAAWLQIASDYMIAQSIIMTEQGKQQ